MNNTSYRTVNTSEFTATLQKKGLVGKREIPLRWIMKPSNTNRLKRIFISWNIFDKQILVDEPCDWSLSMFSVLHLNARRPPKKIS